MNSDAIASALREGLTDDVLGNLDINEACELRQFTADRLKAITGLVVIQDHGTPIRVLVPYKMYLAMQKACSHD